MINQEKVDNLSDEELVALALERQDYFLHIINRYKSKLFRYILRLTNIRPEDAEDILQEVFIKAYLNLNSFDSSLKFSSWIYSITHNQVISNHRRRRVRAEGNAVSIDDQVLNNIIYEFDIKRDLDLALLRKNILKILDLLADKYKEVLFLKFLEEKSYEEISDIIKKPVGTVGSLINAAKKEFKKEMAKSGLNLT